MHTLLMPAATSRFPAQPVSSNAELALMLLGPSLPMSQLWSQIRRLAPYARTVLLTGPADSGQEAVARLLLDLGSIPDRPLMVLPGTDAESQLIRSTVPGDVFLFLPEVDRLSPEAQAGLLRLFRQRRSRTFTVVASASEDLRTLVGLGRFSTELAEVLGSVRVVIPSLAERKEDLPMLLGQMLSMRCHAANYSIPQLSDDFFRAAMQHSWPGNLRELTAVAEYLLANTDRGQELTPKDLLRAIGAGTAPRASTPQVRLVKLDEIVREHLYAVLRACHGNKLRAAEILGISRSTLYRMLDAAEQTGSLRLAS